MRKIAISAVIAACGPEIPDAPTYFGDVQPILRANCARCHGAEPADPRVARFRLDRYVKGDAATFDAYDYAIATETEAAPMIRVAVDHEAPAMPPDYSLSDRQREILARWSALGAPKGTRDNRAPRIELIAPTEIPTADQSIDLTFRAWDDDLDGLVVQLWAHDLATAGRDEDVALGPPTGAGLHALTVDTGALASLHRFEVYAVLDDGFSDEPAENRTLATVIASLNVDHGARGTAPTVRLTAPNGGETLIGSTTIAWTATDPDQGDSLAIDLALVRMDTSAVAATIATGAPNTGSFEWTIPPTIPTEDASGPIPYVVRVTATDALGMPPNTRSDDSDASLSIARPEVTTLTWEDVKPIFLAYCGDCHGQPAKTMALESFRLDKYDASDPAPPVNSDPGVFEMKNTVYQRLITQGNMPPASEPDPSTADRDRIANWILGGAPRGGGPIDARPSFTWMEPSMLATGSTVMLRWSATDTEGLASGRIEYARLNGMPALGCGTTTNVTWMSIAEPQAMAMLGGATSWTDAFTWTIPPTNGYYCVRGVVVDTANQTTTVVNPFGIK